MKSKLKRTAHLMVAAALLVPAATTSLTVAVQAAAELPEGHICKTLPRSDPRWRPGGYCELAVDKMYMHGGTNPVFVPKQDMDPCDEVSLRTPHKSVKFAALDSTVAPTQSDIPLFDALPGLQKADPSLLLAADECYEVE